MYFSVLGKSKWQQSKVGVLGPRYKSPGQFNIRRVVQTCETVRWLQNPTLARHARETRRFAVVLQ